MIATKRTPPPSPAAPVDSCRSAACETAAPACPIRLSLSRVPLQSTTTPMPMPITTPPRAHVRDTAHHSNAPANSPANARTHASRLATRLRWVGLRQPRFHVRRATAKQRNATSRLNRTPRDAQDSSPLGQLGLYIHITLTAPLSFVSRHHRQHQHQPSN